MLFTYQSNSDSEIKNSISFEGGGIYLKARTFCVGFFISIRRMMAFQTTRISVIIHRVLCHTQFPDKYCALSYKLSTGQQIL